MLEKTRNIKPETLSRRSGFRSMHEKPRPGVGAFHCLLFTHVYINVYIKNADYHTKKGDFRLNSPKYLFKMTKQNDE